ncbi:MAG: glycine betaine ABC transporter substrate-binding protein, partial [Eubacteriales bacterium]
MYKNLRGWRKLLVVALIAVVSLTLVVGCSSASKEPAASEDMGTVNIGYVNWAECVAASNLWKVILEEQGYTVELTALDVAPLYVGLSKNDVNLFLDSWLPITHQTYWESYGDKIEDCGIWYEEPAKIGLVVPKYVTIDSIAQMKDEAAKFESQIIGIDAGAGIMGAAAKANENYALGFEVVQGSEAAMMAAMDKAYRNNEWIAITGWSPHWMFAKYDLKYLDDPNKDFGEAEEVHALANKEFATAQPEVVAMIKKFKMSDAQIGGLEALINDGMDPLEAAKQ